MQFEFSLDKLKKHNKKMIAVDLDSTLLRADKTVSDYTTEILERCKIDGHLVVFATARSECECKEYSDLINPHAIISNRGAIVKLGNEIIHRATVDIETSNQMIKMLINNPNVGFLTVLTEKSYLKNISADEHDPIWGEYIPDGYTDFSTDINVETYKISAEIFDEATAGEIVSAFPHVNAVRFSGENWYSYAHKSVSKWEGIKALAAYIGFNIKDVIAFGDDFSDIEMVRECGIGVAVGNAIPEVIAVADIICDTNDNDGVAKWLEANI